MRRTRRLILIPAFITFLAGKGTAVANILQADSVDRVEARGPILSAPVPLENCGDGLWRATVNIDRAGGQYSDNRFHFILNEDPALCLGRVPGTYGLAFLSDAERRTEDIRLNPGTYDITVDLNAMVYRIDSDIDTLRISVFGSSVANGQGADDLHGYAYGYGEQLKDRYLRGIGSAPFYTSGISIGGNTTVDLLNRYPDVLNDFGKYVIVGLSMGNEGLHEAGDREAIFRQFSGNMSLLMDKLKKDGKIPVVVNNYTRGDYNEADYEYIKRINLSIHEWDVPSVNSLGAIDDGRGRWAPGYEADAGHPNTAGHREFTYAMVPSLFDALSEGKPQPQRHAGASVDISRIAPLCFTPEGTVHPFTVCLRIKGSESGRLLTFEDASADSVRVAFIDIADGGKIGYTSPRREVLTTNAPVTADGQWHDIALSNYYALGRTVLYVDGVPVGTTDGALSPVGAFTVGSPGKDNGISLSEVTFWRSAMNADEMKAHAEGRMLKSSLELYSPMIIDEKGNIANRAQSTNALRPVDSTEYLKTNN